MRIGFECRQCGWCCTKYSGELTVKAQDIVRWRKEGREDILAKVRVLEAQGLVAGGEIWMEPKAKGKARVCPFLGKDRGAKKARCLIHDTKPQVCRKYPFTGVNVRMECRGIKIIK